jgi:hypothetical protein
MINMIDKFGFEVVESDGEYSVRLPHSCDSWCITGNQSYSYVSKERAIEEMEQFIKEAQEAIEIIRNGA